MKISYKFAAICAFLLYFSLLNAQPTSLFWTNCTTDVTATGTATVESYNFFSVFNKRGKGQSFNPDIGFLVGIFSWKNLSAEAGIDYLGGADDPLYFNAKIGMPEDKLFKYSPSWSLGIFNIGTRTRTKNKTNQDVIDFIIGKSLPKCIGGKIYFGGFHGNKAIGKDRNGLMVGMTIPFHHTKDCKGREYDKWAITADYATGKNTLGGGGVAVSYYFNPDIYLETGPVWFNTAKYNGSWKWSVQIYLSFELFVHNKNM